MPGRAWVCERLNTTRGDASCRATGSPVFGLNPDAAVPRSHLTADRCGPRSAVPLSRRSFVRRARKAVIDRSRLTASGRDDRNLGRSFGAEADNRGAELRMKASLVALIVILLHACSVGRAAENLRDGDIIFQTSKSGQSLAIQRATNSPYSHMGLVVLRDGEPFVFEASATVRFTPLKAWIERGDGGRYVVKRLRDADTRLTPAVLKKARALARKLEGKKYDLTFEWSDDRMYCSELVWKIYKRALGAEIGALQKLRELRLDDAAVKAKLLERYGSNIPLDEPVISPAAMFDSPELVTVVQH